MKLRNLICFMLALVTLLLTGCGSATSADSTTETLTNPEDTTVNRTYSVLFIGNSYTFYNVMPAFIFEKIAEAAGYQVDVTSITNGGYMLSQFADPSDEYGAKVEEALTGEAKYDFVVLQEQSLLPATEDVSDFFGAVRNLFQRIKATGATPVLYATWSRKEGNNTMETYGLTTESMTWKLAAAYQAIGDELGIPVAHVGLAFYDVINTQGDIKLYDADQSHPSYKGSYLAASTLFAKIFNADPTDVTFTGKLSSEEAGILYEAAKKAVFETPAVPDEYKIISEGVG